MKSFKCLIAGVLLSLSLPSLAEESLNNLENGFISDELFIYMHSGAGNNYRILGTINSGTEIKLTGQSQNEYTEIIDDKNRRTWVESKYVSTTPGLRSVIAELNQKLASSTNDNESISSSLTDVNSQLSALTAEKESLSKQVIELNKQLVDVSSKLKSQDMDMKKEWFFNGALVLIGGLILGLFLPRLAARRKSSMDSWK